MKISIFQILLLLLLTLLLLTLLLLPLTLLLLLLLLLLFHLFLFRAEPLVGEAGRVVKWYGTTIDIEQRKQAELALRESEQRFRDYAEMASDWLWESGPDHRFTLVSNQLAAAGIGEGFRLGRTRWELATDLEDDPEKWRRHVAIPVKRVRRHDEHVALRDTMRLSALHKLTAEFIRRARLGSSWRQAPDLR